MNIPKLVLYKIAEFCSFKDICSLSMTNKCINRKLQSLVRILTANYKVEPADIDFAIYWCQKFGRERRRELFRRVVYTCMRVDYILKFAEIKQIVTWPIYFKSPYGVYDIERINNAVESCLIVVDYQKILYGCMKDGFVESTKKLIEQNVRPLDLDEDILISFDLKICNVLLENKLISEFMMKHMKIEKDEAIDLDENDLKYMLRNYVTGVYQMPKTAIYLTCFEKVNARELMVSAITDGRYELFKIGYNAYGNMTYKNLAIRHAARQNNLEIIKYIYKHGGKPTKLAFNWAFKKRNWSICEWLYEHDDEGTIPLSYIRELLINMFNKLKVRGVYTKNRRRYYRWAYLLCMKAGLELPDNMRLNDFD